MKDIKEYKFVLIDLWGTIFIERKEKSNKLNMDRAKILSEECNCNNVGFWHNKLLENIKKFKIEEKKGTSIKPIERIQELVNCTEKTKKILLEFDNLYYNKYIPDINCKLLNSICDKQVLILVSNTGLITKNCIIKILKQYNLYNKFDGFYFSEDYDFCKPNIEFFKKPINDFKIKNQDVIMFGDSKEMDFLPCKKLGIDCIIKDWSK